MNVCMYVCMPACMYVCMYVLMDVLMDVWMYVCMYVCMYVLCMYVCMYACMYGCICNCPPYYILTYLAFTTPFQSTIEPHSKPILVDKSSLDVDTCICSLTASIRDNKIARKIRGKTFQFPFVVSKRHYECKYNFYIINIIELSEFKKI